MGDLGGKPIATTKKIRPKEVLGILLFYFSFSLVYHIVLWYNTLGFERDGFWGWVSIRDYWFASGMQYSFYFLTSFVIWFLGVFLLRGAKKRNQIIAVAVLIPIGVYVTREIRYGLIDAWGMSRLRDQGEIWDWYIPSLFLFVQFGCFFTYRYFLENQRKLKLEGELRQAALKSELQAIKAQLNPHFLYNVFNTINASVPPTQEKTRQMIATLADLFRYQLKASKKELVTLREELDFVKKYLDLEKARFEERLEVDLNISEDLMDEKIPPMLLQPLVENSVKHGISDVLKGGKISISIFKEGAKLKFEISDTGKGIKDKTNIFDKGVGLNNTRLRLQKMYQSRLELLDNEPQGLKIRFAL